jgi:hypothetical protein
MKFLFSLFYNLDSLVYCLVYIPADFCIGYCFFYTILDIFFIFVVKFLHELILKSKFCFISLFGYLKLF